MKVFTLMSPIFITMAVALPTDTIMPFSTLDVSSNTADLKIRQWGNCNKCEAEYIKHCIDGIPLLTAGALLDCKRKICYSRGMSCNECRFCWHKAIAENNLDIEMETTAEIENKETGKDAGKYSA
ncbi:hypothetical protein B0J11DRAFT_584219 [Dendryphion nanum]|uniref:Uncharacterized protein n=1 Tax=Dendryphion nanum TaxID=256645 RepID=A0A9P9DC06_9PLEO|nr:hypothetical protein B0J11DRAFT_584219 [Dendryphion nanum]